MIDIQGGADERQVPLEKVGVRDLRYPIVVLDRDNIRQRTVAQIEMSVSLPHHFRGTHMSRFLEVLNEHRGEVTMRTIPDILGDLRSRLDAETAQMSVRFPYFLERRAPSSGKSGLLDYECTFSGTVNCRSEDFVLRVNVPVMSLCPCSKAISDYGAHNQRGYVAIEVRTGRDDEGHPHLMWIEEVIEIAETSASAPIYPLMKREDERHVTMQAFDNPVFVEDIVRNAALKLRKEPRVRSFVVEAVNHESIHNHNAFAMTSWTRLGEAVSGIVSESMPAAVFTCAMGAV